MTADRVGRLLGGEVQAINVGLRSFAETVQASGGSTVHVEWRPPAGGDEALIRLLDRLRAHTPHGSFASLDQANQAVALTMAEAHPWLVDVRLAREVIPALAAGSRRLLHAGPPIDWPEMTGPMRGAVIGAALFEGWAANPPAAERLADGGEITFTPCHDVAAVGPMGGITSPSMPVLVVENRAAGQDGNRAYCTLNEGIGKVLRFGAYGPEVLERLTWMRDVLGPALGEAVRASGGIELRGIVARAMAMGDELHQRNVAASSLLLRELGPWLARSGREPAQLGAVFQFLGETEQFFLNVAMACAKVAADAAHTLGAGTVVTAMSRNGVRFGIRLSGTGDGWFTAPVNTPSGMYFSGFSEQDGSPDIGDSAITETVGWGGMAMAAAPGVIRFVGAGSTFEDALRITREQSELCVAENPYFPLPALDFRPLPIGIDATRVVELGETPLINTGIAHREPGIGQVGAGTVNAPLACFVEAVRAYAEELLLAEPPA